MQQAEEAIELLNSIGPTRYHLATDEPRKIATGPKKQREMKGGPCPVCERETIPSHDKRSHRKSPDAFTDEDLEARGMRWA